MSHGVCQSCGKVSADSRVMLKLKIYIDGIYKLQRVYCRTVCLKSDLRTVGEIVTRLYPPPLHFPLSEPVADSSFEG